MTSPIRTVVCEETAVLEMPIAALDLKRLQEVFSQLFDRVLLGVQRAGLDCDDVVLERSLALRLGDGAPQWRVIEYLSDRPRLEAELSSKPPFIGTHGQTLLDLSIVAARVIAIRENVS